MAYGDDDAKRLRDEAKRDTELALERERLQKESRAREHEATVRMKTRELEGQISRKERELRALELEESSLERTIRTSRLSSRGTGARSVSALERLIRDVRVKLEGAKRDERALDTELRSESRHLEDTHSTISSEDQRLTSLVEQERTEARMLERTVKDLERELEEKRTRFTAVTHELEESERALREVHSERGAQDDKRKVGELAKKSQDLKEMERALSAELVEHERELDAARTEERKEEEQAAHGRTAELRKTEQDRKKRKLSDEIEGLKRELNTLKRDIH